MQKKIIFCFSLICLFVSLVITVYAYRLSPYLYMETTLDDIPKNTAYIDLLLPIQKKDEHFVAQKEEISSVHHIFDNSLLQLPRDCEIANYDDAYYSYLFHFNDSTISVRPIEDGFYINYGEEQKLLDDYLLNVDDFKVAFVDAQGNIIQVSDSLSAKSSLTKEFTNLKIVNGEVSEEYMDIPLFSYSIYIFPLCIIGIVIAVIHKQK